MIKAILFDLDGTLLDTAPDFVAALSELFLEEKQKPLPENFSDLVVNSISNGSSAMLNAAFEVTPDSKEFENLKARFIAYYLKLQYQQTQFFSGITQILDYCQQKGLPWGIVTNRTSKLATPLLAHFQLLQKASCVICGDTLAQAKPYPAPVLYACSQIRQRPRETLFLGDAKIDVLAGKAAGTHTAVAGYGYVGDRALAKRWPADHFMDSPQTLLTLLS